MNMRGTIYQRIQNAKHVVLEGDPRTAANRKRIAAVLDEVFMVLVTAEKLAEGVVQATQNVPRANELKRRIKLRSY